MNFVFQNAFYCHVCHRSLCVISYEPAVARITTFVANLSRNKIQCCKSAEFTRAIGQSCVIKDGSFFHII